MSLDEHAKEEAGDDPASVGDKKNWMLRGCGCLALLAVLVIAGLVWFAVSQYNQIKQEAKSFVESSSVVQGKLGSPVTIEREQVSTDSEGKPVFEFDVVGPEGKGTVLVWAGPDKEEGDLAIDRCVLVFGDEEIDLNKEEEFGIDIEGMDDF